MDELSHQKVEHAVLWSMVKQSYDGEFICPPSIAAKLLNIAPESQIRVVVDHLLATGYVADKSAPFQEHFEPTRKAYLKIEQLVPMKSSFVGRLNIHGPNWLRSQSALDANLESRLEGEAVGRLPSAPAPGSPSVVINNSVAPVLHNEMGEKRDAADPIALSSRSAGWFGAWGAWLAAIVAVLTLLWILHEAKVF